MTLRRDHPWTMFIGGHAEPDRTACPAPSLPTDYQVSEPGEGLRFVRGLSSHPASKTSTVSILHLTFTFNNLAAHGIPLKHQYVRVSRLSIG
jgi:hypothetical protein